MIELLKKYFDIMENTGDTYNDITVLLISCNSFAELQMQWVRLNKNKKFDNLSKGDLMKAVSLKNRLKYRLIKTV